MFEQQFINFMEKFDSVPFTIKTQDHTYQIGKGEPTFSVFFHKVPSAYQHFYCLRRSVYER